VEIIQLNAGNDRNGNPRRVFVALEDGEIVGTWDDGYRGRGALPESLRGRWGGFSLVRGCRFDTSPSEYRRLVKLGRELA